MTNTSLKLLLTLRQARTARHYQELISHIKPSRASGAGPIDAALCNAIQTASHRAQVAAEDLLRVTTNDPHYTLSRANGTVGQPHDYTFFEWALNFLQGKRP